MYVCMYVCAVRNLESHKPKPEQLSSADAIRHIEGFVELQSKLIPPKSTEEVGVCLFKAYALYLSIYTLMYVCMYVCMYASNSIVVLDSFSFQLHYFMHYLVRLREKMGVYFS